MRRLLVVTSLLTCALAARAHADQCQLVDADVADWAQKILARGASVVSFCEPCGDKAPKAATAVSSVSAKSDGGQRELAVNGRDVDLAYLFVQTGKSTYTNVALMAGCQTTGVSPTVHVRASSGGVARFSQTWGKKLPQACRDYERTLKRIATQCTKMPAESREALLEAYDAMKDAWANIDQMPEEGLRAMADGCRQGNDAINQAAKQICGW